MFVDPRTLQKAIVPSDLRSALLGGAEGAVTDHAGYLAS
jgi:hypothetical protein